MNNDSGPTWWTSLKHGGLLIAPAKISQHFPSDIDPLPRYQVDRLRRDVTRLGDNPNDVLASLLDTILEDILGLETQYWIKAGGVGTEWSRRSVTGEVLRPRRLWQSPQGAILPVFVDTSVKRIGIAGGRRTVARAVEWLRKADQKVALLTNGRQWRLIHAGADYDAWCEWDTAFWFVEGQPGPQVDALRILLGAQALTVVDGQKASLLTAIEASRSGQAELSTVLGERARLAAELLIRESAEPMAHVIGTAGVTSKDVYIAANRIMMRLVIILFAEARDLLPRDNTVYHGSYGIQGLREQLDRRAGGRAKERLRNSYSAWPRLLALFRLIYSGSPHAALPVPAYGGSLFAPGDLTHADPVRRAVTAFESVHDCPSDAAVHRILDLLTRSQIKVRQGNRSTWVDAPVDFSDLSSEYVGMLYQGLLDFELRQAADDEPMIFLNLGDQPVLPLARLEDMDDDALATLVEKLGTKSKPSAGAEEGDEQDREEEEREALDEEVADDEEAIGEDDIEPPIEDEEDAGDVIAEVRARAVAWASRTVEAGKLVKKPRGRAAATQTAYRTAIQSMADRLIARVILPGEWFLVRWGGTRKGSGTFYTRPQLGTPLVRRTLQPLCYDEINGRLVPKKPEVILALKVCDSSVGSGSLLVGSLRYLTDALYESLYYHGRITAHGEYSLCRLADGQATDTILEETLPVPPDHPEFEERLKSRLKRYVVERCIYGVDLDPLAVELARLSLWIETMDPSLPFEFLDHKIKCGNSLVGCWFDRFQDYPVMAWEREGGDKNHDRFVHHYRDAIVTRGKQRGQTVRKGDRWTQAIKDMRDAIIKPQMRRWILSQENPPFEFARAGYTAASLHDQALAVFQELHALPVHETARKAALYQEKVAGNSALQQLKLAFDTWCAIWFWPGDELALAPTPEDFHAPSADAIAIVNRIEAKMRFFHWELEFPDVFTSERSGFDAMVQNPPWDILKPKSQEYFSNIDPLYRSYTKQQAIASQLEYFAATAEIERDWLEYSANFRAMSNWAKNAAFPFGDDSDGGDRFAFTRSVAENQTLHGAWRRRRAQRQGYADSNHPFRYLGSADLNSYKMFLEQFHALLQIGGHMGAIVPSGIASAKGCMNLRSLFLNKCSWHWLFGFVNEELIFDIHHAFKFYCMIVQKGGQTSTLKAAFMRRFIIDWEQAEKYVLDYSRSDVLQFSPVSKALIEIETARDLDTLGRLYHSSELLSENTASGWQIQYKTEFHLTNDSALFPVLGTWERSGYRADQYGHWLKGNWQPVRTLSGSTPGVLTRDRRYIILPSEVEGIALPLYEGRMIGQFDLSQQGWVSGRGRTAVWRQIPFEHKVIEPQYLLSLRDYAGQPSGTRPSRVVRGSKAAFMNTAAATNTRTVIATVLPDMPCGNSVPVLAVGAHPYALAAILNSYIYDYEIRVHSAGLSLNYFIIEESTLPETRKWQEIIDLLDLACLQLVGVNWLYAREWLSIWPDHRTPLERMLAITAQERLRLRCILDAIVAHMYSVELQDLEWIMRDCDHPVGSLASNTFTSSFLPPKGFWRVDREVDPELRHTVLAQVAFHDLQEKGLDAFLSKNDGAGWMIPETLRLADYGLGHDDRAKEHQPVAARLGPRFLPWQLEGTPEQSWEECERHAENLRLLLGNPEPEKKAPAGTKVAELRPSYETGTEAVQLGLFVDSSE